MDVKTSQNPELSVKVLLVFVIWFFCSLLSTGKQIYRYSSQYLYFLNFLVMLYYRVIVIDFCVLRSCFYHLKLLFRENFSWTSWSFCLPWSPFSLIRKGWGFMCTDLFLSLLHVSGLMVQVLLIDSLIDESYQLNFVISIYLGLSITEKYMLHYFSLSFEINKFKELVCNFLKCILELHFWLCRCTARMLSF